MLRWLLLLGSGYASPMDTKRLGQAGLVGVKGRIGERVADEVGSRTRLDRDLVAAVIGALLFVASLVTVVRTLARLRRAV
jgi:hypothetical protein